MRKMELLILLLTVSLIAGAANADITTGLQGYWAFEDGEGATTAVDSTPGATGDYDGEFLGTPEWADGPEGFGGALQFRTTGNSDGLTCGTCNPSAETDKFTVAIWAYWNGPTGVTYDTQHFMTKGGYHKMWQWEVWSGHGSDTYKDKVGMSFVDAGSVPFCLMPVEEWVHLAFTFDGTNLALYVNGVPDGSGPKAFTMGTDEASTFYIGVADNTTRSFDGYLDEARVYNRVLTQADIQALMATDKAVNIEPKNGEPLAAVDTNLSWGPPSAFVPTKYDLRYKVGDPNFTTGATIVNNIAHTDPCNVYDTPANFANEVTVYWRVDSYAPGYPSDPCTGSVWHFTTMPEYPVITEDPCSLTVAAGDTAVFRVKDVNGVTYVWEKKSGGTVGGSSPVLTLTNVQQSNEDSYRCVVKKTGQPDVTSAWAVLWTKRLVAQWDFEGNLNDSEGDWPGVYVDPNEANPQSPTAVYGSGLDGGQALQLIDDPCYVWITDSEEFFNFYPLGYSANVWIKRPEQADWGCMVSKQDRTGDDHNNYLGWLLVSGDGDNLWNGLRGVAGIYNGNVGISNNEWHMVTTTYDAEAGVLMTYVDGEPIGSDTDASVALTNTYPVILGAEFADDGYNAYEGLLDRVGIYSYGLSPVEVAVLYIDVMGGEICAGGNPENDLNDDCRVDLEDFAILATNWLKCNLVPVSLCP